MLVRSPIKVLFGALKSEVFMNVCVKVFVCTPVCIPLG